MKKGSLVGYSSNFGAHVWLCICIKNEDYGVVIKSPQHVRTKPIRQLMMWRCWWTFYGGYFISFFLRFSLFYPSVMEVNVCRVACKTAAFSSFSHSFSFFLMVWLDFNYCISFLKSVWLAIYWSVSPMFLSHSLVYSLSLSQYVQSMYFSLIFLYAPMGCLGCLLFLIPPFLTDILTRPWLVLRYWSKWLWQVYIILRGEKIVHTWNRCLPMCTLAISSRLLVEVRFFLFNDDCGIAYALVGL